MYIWIFVCRVSLFSANWGSLCQSKQKSKQFSEWCSGRHGNDDISAHVKTWIAWWRYTRWRQHWCVVCKKLPALPCPTKKWAVSKKSFHIPVCQQYDKKPKTFGKDAVLIPTFTILIYNTTIIIRGCCCNSITYQPDRRTGPDRPTGLPTGRLLPRTLAWAIERDLCRSFDADLME